MIKVTEYRDESKGGLQSEKEMTHQDALFDLVSRLSGSTIVTFVGYGYLIQLDWEDSEREKVCVSYFGEKDDVNFLLLEEVTKRFVLVTRQCSANIHEELRHEFWALAEKFIRV